MNKQTISFLLLLLLFSSCAVQRIDKDTRANIYLPLQPVEKKQKVKYNDRSLPDVFDLKDKQGNNQTYARTERDKDGNSQISVKLKEVTVTAKMKTVPERFGKVDVDFIVSVPQELINSKWQLNLSPHLIKADRIFDFEDLVVSGPDFRKVQQEQYARYTKYLSKIVPDSLLDHYFVDTKAFHRYIDRYNKSELNRIYKDSTAYAGYLKYKSRLNKRYAHFNAKMYNNQAWLKEKVGESETYSRIVNLLPMFHLFREFSLEYIEGKYRKGKYRTAYENDSRLISGADSIFLKKRFLKDKEIARNRQLIDNKHIAYAELVKFPKNEKARLDTVIYTKGKFEYYYKQQVSADEDSRRMRIYLDGYVQAVNTESFLLPHSDTLEYVVSSMIQFLDMIPRYVRKIIERRSMSTLRANITFKTGKSDMNVELGDNASELAKVQDMLEKLTETGEFVLDSISLIAGCSPEGSSRSNMLLSQLRAESIQKYLGKELSGIEGIGKMLKPYSKGEDWQGLSKLIEDSLVSRDKQAILQLISLDGNQDRKEADLRNRYLADYRQIRDKLYPSLRAVDFTFHVHRKGMVKDTIHTTEPDTIYALGMELMSKRKYAEALQILHEYNDYNTAICLMSLGYDQAASVILKGEPESANREYLLAVLTSRLGDDQEAVRYYLRSVELDPAKRWRGILDPEINRLIKQYQLNEETDDDL